MAAAEDTGPAADEAGVAERAAASCGGMSFTASTKVLLASGAAVPIASLKRGDKVLATDTKTGKTRAEPVTAVLVHHDTNRYDLAVETAQGTAVIHTTTTHLFWDPATRHWTKAAALTTGDRLLTAGEAAATVVRGVTPRAGSGWMWDLTIANDHDFYVDAASVTVLVHNCGPEEPSIRPLHSKETLDQSSYNYWSSKGTSEIVESLCTCPGLA